MMILVGLGLEMVCGWTNLKTGKMLLLLSWVSKHA